MQTPPFGPPDPGAPPPAGRDIAAWRIRFTSDPAPAGADVLRRFTHPRPAVALREPADPQRPPPGDDAEPEPTDQLHVILVPPGGPGERRAAAAVDPWLGRPRDGRTTTVRLDGGRIHWRPGRALVECPAESAPTLLDAVVDFAFLEGELRRLERALSPYESGAPGDVARAYRIRAADRGHWDRLGEIMEHLARIRLTCARLKPQLAAGAPPLPPEGRRAVSRMLARADVPARLEAFDERLEACEDLYEGAVDRITDFRWYRTGYWLEVAIVVLLLLEVVLLVYTFPRP
jgi:hypothetical protein